MSIKVSVVIPTYNRFDYLLNAVNSIKDQNFSDFEILIINDGSTDENYYENKLSGTNIKQIDLEENQKIKNGFASDAIRNMGIEHAMGKYIAFLDDDDIWLSNKLNKQYNLLESSENKMSSTEGLFGFGTFNSKSKYKLFNEEYYFNKVTGKAQWEFPVETNKKVIGEGTYGCVVKEPLECENNGKKYDYKD